MTTNFLPAAYALRRRLILAPLALGLALGAASTATAQTAAPAPSQMELPEAAYYIDGLPATAADAKKLESEKGAIVNMHVLKGEAVRKLLGDGAPTSAIIITSKKNKDSAAVQAFNKRVEEVTPTQKMDLATAYILVDGKETTEAELKKIPPARIKDMRVYKGAEAEKQYGAKGRSGVVVVTTR
ncbi:hypothetical protein [Hymenobacter sediminicola]|uniref:TonB-dependent receptor plug domain-containing protein n=1 Tax=Hymenobacter sediminicola TaxID=2761579 RepID=A0A7G7W7S4_9BACT|nr:hypothetical protein [Hymenobacter sediminicola]QNH62417.1 hypothetical protein H4317_00885 [Hymenobacter sediminicola]